VNDELGKILKEAFMAYLRYYPGILLLEGEREKATQKTCQNSRSPS
jgi:hypothetical protein